MKLTKETLKRIIKEELGKVMHEEFQGQIDLGEYTDASNKAQAELDSMSYVVDGFEEAAAKALAEMGGEDDLNFPFVTTTLDGGNASFNVTLVKDGRHELAKTL